MLSKSQIKLITSLKQKKYRQQYQLFVAEGKKTIFELLQSNLNLNHLYSTTLEFDVSDDLFTQVSENELKKISFLINSFIRKNNYFSYLLINCRH